MELREDRGGVEAVATQRSKVGRSTRGEEIEALHIYNI